MANEAEYKATQILEEAARAECCMCSDTAKMAIRTTRPYRTDLKVTWWPDAEFAPKKASRYCKTHGQHLLNDLVKILVEDDVK